MGLVLTMHWIETRKYHVFAFFLVFSGAAALCFGEGYLTNPYLPKLPPNKPTSFQWGLGEKEFTLPNFIHAGIPNSVSVWCNVSGYNLVVGSPLYVAVAVEISTTIYQIIGVTVIPSNALKCEPIAFENFPLIEPLTPSRFYLIPKGNGTTFFPFESKVYSGDDWVEFQAAGSVELTVTIELLPTWDFMSEYALWQNFTSMFPDNQYTLVVPLPSIIIESGSIVQQQVSYSLNLSLTYFVLFFASVDIAVALYDHSEDKDKKAEYDKEKASKKLLKNAEINQDIV